jgi:hypothetical protein
MRGLWDDIIQWRDNAETVLFDAVDWMKGETVELTESVKSEWRSRIAQLRQKAGELDQASRDLDATQELAYSISYIEARKWDDARAELDRLRSLYATAFSVIDGAANTLRSVGLGALPFALPISLAGIAALIAASTAALVTVYSAIEGWKSYRLNQLVELGVTPTEANAQVEGEYPTAPGQAWSTAIPQTAAYVALGIAAVVLLPNLMKGRR